MGPASSIAHYRNTSKLGEGGRGEGYRAPDTKLNREVTIKVLSESFAQDLDRMARFTREAQLLASLNRPNIAAIHIPRVRVQFVDGRDSCRAIKVRRGCSQDGAQLRIGTLPRMLRLTRLPVEELGSAYGQYSFCSQLAPGCEVRPALTLYSLTERALSISR